MRKTLLTAFAAAALLSSAMLASPAGAITLAAPSAIGVAATNTGLVQKTAVVCGYRGCVRVHPRRYYNYYGYATTDGPIGTMDGPTAGTGGIGNHRSANQGRP